MLNAIMLLHAIIQY